MSFSQFNFHPNIAEGIRSCNFSSPTPIQEKAIPVALEGNDILGLAQTGTGKTAAYVLPILQRLIKGPRGKARALIVAPTRELTEQIHCDIGKLAKKTGLRSVAIYGGVSKIPQIRKIRGGAEIIVACPGRLLDHVKEGDIHLGKIELLVLDEADHMFDMGFLPSIRSILKLLPENRQTLLFSATMPDTIRLLAEEILDEPVSIQIARSRPAETVTQKLFPVEQQNKTSLLKEIIATNQMAATLIFTRTKYRAESLARQLQKAGYRATSIQGNLSQQKRQRALDGFKCGEYKILVATDIAARGIDVSRISHVINYDVPDTVDAYTHRIGRTGRMEKTGEAFTFAGQGDKKIIDAIERSLGKKMERSNMHNPGEEKQAGNASHDAREPAAKAMRHIRHASGDKERQPSSRYRNPDGKQKRHCRAALLSPGSGNIFLNPRKAIASENMG